MSDKEEAGEAYLDQLLDSMVSGEFSAEENTEVNTEENTEVNTEEVPAEPMSEDSSESDTLEEAAPDTSFLNDILEDEPKQYNNITDENGEDLTELLGMLAEHYEEEQENQKEITKNIEDSPMGMDEVFQDALSAVSYMENEEDEPGSDAVGIALEDGIDIDSTADTEEENLESHFSEFEQSVSEEELLDGESLSAHAAEEDEPKKKKSFRERFFHNIIDEKEAEKELAEREAEAISEQEKEAAKEEKKKNAAEAKEEKERLKQEKEEKKAQEKEIKAQEKQKKKEEKAEAKRLRQEEEAREIVGRINPVGAAIVWVFFSAIGLLVIFGTWFASYASSVHNAEIYMDTGDYERAYQEVSGLHITKESDKELYEKTRICAKLTQQLNGCENYLIMGRYAEALDSLIKGVKEYDADAVSAEKLKIKDKQDALGNELADKLQTEFKMTMAEARQILQSETRELYTARVKEKVAGISAES